MSHCSSLAAVGRSRRIEIPPSAAEFKREKVELKENIESEISRSQCNKKPFLLLLPTCVGQRGGRPKAVGSNQSTRTVPAAGSKQQKMASKEKRGQRRAIFNRRIDEGFQYYSPSSLLVCCYLSRGRGKYLSASAICKSDTGAWSIAGRSAESMLDKIRIYPVARHRFCLLDVIDATRPTFISLCPWAAN